MPVGDMIRWPPRCSSCRAVVDDWLAAGHSNGLWFHKSCWLRLKSVDHASLRSPAEAVLSPGLPMILFLLLLHFGGGAAVLGWFMLTQADHGSISIAILAGGLLAFVTGISGFISEIILRRRRELVRFAMSKDEWLPVEES